jgi:hypothetical protein
MMRRNREYLLSFPNDPDMQSVGTDEKDNVSGGGGGGGGGNFLDAMGSFHRGGGDRDER